MVQVYPRPPNSLRYFIKIHETKHFQFDIV